MIVDALVIKIASLFLMMFAGYVMVRCKVLQPTDAKPISEISLYLIFPCVIIVSFQIDYTQDIRDGLILATIAAVIIHIILLGIPWIFKNKLNLDAVEKVTVIYSNSGNLIIPLIAATLGPKYVIYTSAYTAVQTVLLWSHCRYVLMGGGKINILRILLNINLLAVIIGGIIFFCGIKLWNPVYDAMASMGVMIGPACMLVTGMVIASMNLKKVIHYPRLPFIVALRLVIMPAIILPFLWILNKIGNVPDSAAILLVPFLATAAPSASSITQMSILYHNNTEYAGLLNMVSTLLCIVTYPAFVWVYDLII